MDRLGSRKHVLGGGCTLSTPGELVNMNEPSMCGGDAAFCQITLTACLSFVRLLSEVHYPENVTSFSYYN